MNIRVILDTNIFISGIFWKGNYCSQIIDAWKSEKITLVSSLEIIQELVQTLQDFKIEMPKAMIDEWRRMIIKNAMIVLPIENLHLIKEDPDDNKFFEAAITGKANYIISQDKHVLKIKAYRGIKTASPEEFVKLLNS